MIRINLDQAGIRKLEQSAQAMKEVVRKAEAIKNDAAAILRKEVRHNEGVTPPEMADSFFVEQRHDDVVVGNHDPAFPLIELGTHPGGGEEEIKYSPLRRAMDRAEE